MLRSHAFIQQMSDAEGDDARLARACTSEDQKRPLCVLYRVTLLRVESAQIERANQGVSLPL